MLQVSELFIYPIKSLGGIAVSSAVVTDRGFQYDRRWMLVDKNNEFMTQREFAEMALLQTEILEDGLKVYHKKKETNIIIPFEPEGETISVQVWSDTCKGIVVGKKANEWFSDVLGKHCRLIYMPDATKRRVDGRYALNKEITNFSDGYPFMMIGQSSLDDLNSRLEEKLPINRFRPNIVVTGGTAYEEDGWAHFTINDINFYGVKLCARCAITTINQDNIKQGKEPLKTLATYRQKNNKIYFGQNLLHHGEGSLHIGDEIKLLERKPSRF
jgi:uncharacterized protein YcbX